MHDRSASRWRHDHTFGQDRQTPGERRTLIVILITGTMMVVEIVAGIAFGSMALLADGLHMASHAVALAIAYSAYIYARRHAHDESFTFGAGKVNALAGFIGAVLLAVLALMMVWESVDRCLHPVVIQFDQAILVAVLGLAVNAVCAVILGQSRGDHDPEHDESAVGRTRHRHHDHNLRSAYLHVVADALTSLLAIFALLTGKYLRAAWMDPAIGIVGAALVANWSFGLIRSTGYVLLDRRAPERIRGAIRDVIETVGECRVSDLHVWSIGPNIYAAIVALVTDTPRSPDYYRELVQERLGLAHVTVEVNVTAGTPSERT